MYTKIATNRSMPDCSVIPVLAYEDVEKAVEWLCTTFGFKERWRGGNHRAQVAIGSGAIALSRQPVDDGPLHRPRHSLMVRVEDAQVHYENSLRRGAKIIQSVTDFPYGERQYSVEDIGGHIWTFSQSIKDVVPEEWGGVTAR